MPQKKGSQNEVEETYQQATQSSVDPKIHSVAAEVLMSSSSLSLKAGELLVICTQPGFRRAGIEHERLKVWEAGELTEGQIEQMRREPLLTLVKVS
ncbi:hypothetical protein GS501_02440 [Saccharibacter sp. 17.LH.SD]|uniref:hypothetical protein n=1 Tax=Saccharibacter sp. 17.LH.SD TaxID=2689393 RepID=UPI00137054CB|nr:hypothetical protein [Saccharibacter sp. 17.LH.SD]MXV43911.1 hypothetical protein [Saccharibacter sp. 17.LH.SD]